MDDTVTKRPSFLKTHFQLAPLLLAALLACCIGPSQARAASGEEEMPINFSADQMDVDQELGIVTARGNVEVIYNERTLYADTISYNQKSDMLTASGNIILMEPSGDVSFAEHMEMSGDFKNGVVENIRMILSDRSRIAANGARRINEDIDLRKAVYSPCQPCADDPTKTPLWQLKAVKVYHDKSQQTLEYSDVWLEVAGVPVMYTPYLSHPDPTVKGKSGFLAPSFGGSTTLGSTLKTPYFWNISPQNDVTITPALYGDKGAGASAEYRQLLRNGEFGMISSIADDDSTILGHVDGFGRFNVDETWRWGFDARASSDDTYLRRYGFRSDQTLTSDVYMEGFRKRNYARAEAIYFQSMEAGQDEAQTPKVAPHLLFQHVGEADKYGGHTNLDSSFVSLTRDDGTDSHRLSVTPGWEANYLSADGDVYGLSVTLESDLYYVQDYIPVGESSASEGFTGRMLPQAKLDWSKPFARTGASVTQTIEPEVSLIVAPNGSNPSDIPNEDSQEFEFDESSLFSFNKFSGNDRVEGGTRIDYGMNWGVYGEGGGKTTAFVGQSYRLRKDSLFPENSGLEDNFSDVVAKFEVSPGAYYNLLYRTRVDKSNGEVKRNEVLVSAGAPLFQVSAQYLQFERQEGSEFGGRESVSLGFSSKFDRFWRTNGSIYHDIAEHDTRSIKFGLTYEDECLIFNTALSRTFYQDRDLAPSDAILFTVNFKTLGEWSTSPL